MCGLYEVLPSSLGPAKVNAETQAVKSKVDIFLTNKIQDFWVNFIKTGNPNKQLTEWQQFDSNVFNVLSFNDEISMKTSSSLDVCRVLGY